MKLVIKLNKARSRPIGYTSPGGFVKTAKGWRKAPKKGAATAIKKETASAKSKASSSVMYTINMVARNMLSANKKVVNEALDAGWNPTETAAKMEKTSSSERKERFLLVDAFDFLKKRDAPPSQKRAIPSPQFKGPRAKKGRTK